MERKISRKRDLPSFSMDLAQFESLYNKIIAKLSPGSKTILTSIVITLPSEEITFDNIDELKAFTDLPSKITKLSLMIISGLESIYIYSSPLGKYIVRASSNNEVWCVGIVEMVVSIAVLNKKFYSGVNKIDSFNSMLFMIVTSMIIGVSVQLYKPDFTINFYALISFLFTICLMNYVKGKYLPFFVLEVNKSDNIFKRYSVEFMTVSTIFIAIGTLIIMLTPFLDLP